MNQQSENPEMGLTVKDMVTTGIFTALYLVFTMVSGIFFAPNPVLTFYMPIACALVCGPIYLLLVAKVRKRFSVTLLGILMGALMFVTGMHWGMCLGYIIMGIAADMVAGVGRYRRKVLNMFSYMLLSLAPAGSYLVYFADPDAWARSMLGNGTEQSYIDTMNSTANLRILIIMLVGTLAAAILSAFIGGRLLKNSLKKPGLPRDGE